MLPLKQRMKDIDHYYEDILLSSEPILPAALKAVAAEWSPARGLNLRSQAKVVDLMKKSTNSGNPYFTKRRNVVGQTVPADVSTKSTKIMQALPSGDWESCAILGWRGQEGGYSKEGVKQRVVWMFPFAINLLELQCYQPGIEVAQRHNLVPAWVSMDAVDDRITALFDSKSTNDLVVCTDFSKYDQHFNSDMQAAARTILTDVLASNTHSEKWLREVFDLKYMIPLMYDYGKVRFGRHGMGSGSGGTNFDETLTHRSLQYEAAILSNARLNPNSQCLGDDGILSYPGITVEDVVKAYSKHGQEMNESKQYASTQDCVYLRRWHHAKYRQNGKCVGVYSTMRALGRLRYLERFQDPEYWNDRMVALRQLSILENVKYHPLKDQFAQFCMKRDRYRLGIDIPGFLDNIEKIADEAIDHMPDFLGYTKTMQSASQNAYGIKSWWIVNYLKSQR
nr:RdRp [Porcine picobirnavirus]